MSRRAAITSTLLLLALTSSLALCEDPATDDSPEKKQKEKRHRYSELPEELTSWSARQPVARAQFTH